MKTDNELIAEFLNAGYDIDMGETVFAKNGMELGQRQNKNGYFQINVRIRKKQRTFLVHRLLAIRFIPNPESKPEVNHIDGNKGNNRLSNLEWSTRSENIKHGFSSGLITPPWQDKSGSWHSRSKSVLQIKDDSIVAEHGSIRQAASVTGINRGTIDQVLSGRGKTAGGFQWKYKE